MTTEVSINIPHYLLLKLQTGDLKR